MTEITDDYMLRMRAQTRPYCAMILKAGPAFGSTGADKIIWEHGRRNHALRVDGVLPIVCPVSDGTEVKGIGIFNGTVEEIRKVMDEDPGVKAGIFVYEIHPCRSFPGDRLP
jgi:predicted LPLAT superfamily acyltransferase